MRRGPKLLTCKNPGIHLKIIMDEVSDGADVFTAGARQGIRNRDISA